MKALSERIDWYVQPENRRWKRIWNATTMVFVALMGVGVSVSVYVYGNGTRLQPIFLFLVALISLCAIATSYVLLKSEILPRWQLDLFELVFVCSIGVATVAGVLMLEL